MAPETRTVLIVEDDQILLASCAAAMRSRWTVLTAATGSIAQRLVRQHAVDAALVDLRLPDVTGIELVREFKRVASTMFIAMMSGYGSIRLATEAVRAGACDFLPKPFSPAELRGLFDSSHASVGEIETPTLERAQWEHVHRVVADCDGNISLAARKLAVDRRTVRLWLQMPAPN